MMLPAEGARIIISSDGLWDVVQNIKAVRMVRSKTCKQAVQTLLNAVARDRRLMDDTSVIVVDIMPSADVSFPVMATGRSTPEPSASGGGGLFACFGGGGGAAEPQPVADVSSRGGSAGASMHGGTVKFICDIDTLAAFPQLRGECQRGKGLTRRTPVPTKGPLDFTMHGATERAAHHGRAGNTCLLSASCQSAHMYVCLRACVRACVCARVWPKPDRYPPMPHLTHPEKCAPAADTCSPLCPLLASPLPNGRRTGPTRHIRARLLCARGRGR